MAAIADRENEIIPTDDEIVFTHQEYQPEVAEQQPHPHINELSPETASQLCDHCAENADCRDGACECRPGYDGDGLHCELTCDESTVWSPETGRCELIDFDHQVDSSSEDEENGK